MQSELEFRYLADCMAAVPMVARWWFDAWGPTKASNTAEALAQEVARQLNRSELPVPLVAIQRGEVAGTVVLKQHELKEQYPDLEYWLGNVFVREPLRGIGVGAALVRRVEELARGMGITRLHLATERTDGGLYARLGYGLLHRTQKGAIDLAVMARNLDP